MPTTEYIAEVSEIEGIKIGTQALKACGMQHELAAQIALKNQSMGISLILRAGSPPVYNQKRGPKTGFNLSKTSTQGLFRGSLAKDVRFTRINPETREGRGHHDKDETHLKLPIHHPDYQHTVPLPVTMQDILREVSDEGDLRVLGYEEGRLRLAYKEGRGDHRFNGQFVVNLTEGDSTPMFYSRPWDRPDHHPNWDSENKVIRKPEGLSAVPDEDYKTAFNQSFLVSYTEAQTPDIGPEDLHSANVFANTPRTSRDLRNAILACKDLNQETDEYQAVLALDESNLPARDVLLALFTEDEIKAIYDSCALVTTGDWDGLALGQSPDLKREYPNPADLRVYNTFLVEGGRREKEALVNASCAYFDYLKAKPEIQGTPLGELLNSISNPAVLFSEFAVDRAGCITPHEFLYEQLLNYSYRDKENMTYADQRSRDAMQRGMDAALALSASGALKDQSPEERYLSCLQVATDTYQNALRTKRLSITKGEWIPTMTNVSKKEDLEHLESHLKIALSTSATEYVVPNVSYDHNVHDLFQHGFDMRNPYGSNLEGPWLMITSEGAQIYGDTQEQLTQALLIPGFLEENEFPVSHGADMSAGWGAVVARQIELDQPVSEKTMMKYNAWYMKDVLAQIKQEQEGEPQLGGGYGNR